MRRGQGRRSWPYKDTGSAMSDEGVNDLRASGLARYCEHVPGSGESAVT